MLLRLLSSMRTVTMTVTLGFLHTTTASFLFKHVSHQKEQTYYQQTYHHTHL